jgi:hypothetical protein
MFVRSVRIWEVKDYRLPQKMSASMRVNLNIEEHVAVLTADFTMDSHTTGFKSPEMREFMDDLGRIGTLLPFKHKNTFSIQVRQDPWGLLDHISRKILGIVRRLNLCKVKDLHWSEDDGSMMEVDAVMRFILNTSQRMMLARALPRSPDQPTRESVFFRDRRSADRLMLAYLHMRDEIPTIQLDLADLATRFPEEFDMVMLTLLKVRQVSRGWT